MSRYAHLPRRNNARQMQRCTRSGALLPPFALFVTFVVNQSQDVARRQRMNDRRQRALTEPLRHGEAGARNRNDCDGQRASRSRDNRNSSPCLCASVRDLCPSHIGRAESSEHTGIMALAIIVRYSNHRWCVSKTARTLLGDHALHRASWRATRALPWLPENQVTGEKCQGPDDNPVRHDPFTISISDADPLRA